ASPCNPQASSDRPSWDHFSSNHLGDESCLETGGRIGSWLRSIASNSPGDPKDHTPAPNSDSRSPKSSLSAASAELSALHMEAKMGNATAQYALGLKLLQGDGVRRNEEEAVTWPKPIAAGSWDFTHSSAAQSAVCSGFGFGNAECGRLC